jgi:hypothetical protein
MLHSKRFRFGLRAMFLGLTALACWIGWEFHHIRQRTEWLRWIEEHDGEWRTFDTALHPLVEVNLGKFSMARRLLGDTPVMTILVPSGAVPNADIERLYELFPEAVIIDADNQPILIISPSAQAAS